MKTHLKEDTDISGYAANVEEGYHNEGGGLDKKPLPDLNENSQIEENNVLLPKISNKNADSVATNKEESQRQTWSKEIEFLLACVGNAVGLGNLWRFPYLCYESGGGMYILIFNIFSV